MELHQLRGFYEIAREGSFTKAADRLFVTQPAISLQLKALEDELGERLVERTRGRARLTPAGEILYRRARSVFDELNGMREDMEALRQVVRGRVTVGTSDTNCTYVLPEVLTQFRERYPGVEVDIRNKMSSDVGHLVLEDQVDFGLATLPLRHPGLECEVLFTRRDLLICPPDNALAGRRSVQMKTVAREPLLVLEEGSRSRELLEQSVNEAQMDMTASMCLGSIEVIKRFVEIGFGIAVVPAISVEVEAAAGRLVAVPIRGLKTRSIGLVEHGGRRRSAATSAFVQVMQQRLAGKRL